MGLPGYNGNKKSHSQRGLLSSKIFRGMIKLYVFDECANSSQNGIGTYVFDLCQCLSEEIQITILSFNDSVSSFQKEDRDGVTYMRFPFFCGGAFLDNYEIGLSIIRMEVNDAEENI